jgi:hypothetical protein
VAGVNVFVHDDRVVGPDGAAIADRSPQTVGDLVKLTRWLGNKGVEAPTIWLLGAELAPRYGWLDNADDISATAEVVNKSILAAFREVDPRVIVEKRAYRFTVCRSWARRGEVIAEVVAARLGMITDGHRGVIDDLVTDEPEAEIVHRIQWISEHLSIPAAGPAPQLAARLAERNWNPLPPQGQWPLSEAELSATRFEPVTHWFSQPPQRGGKLVVTDQRRAVLAAMGTVALGVGTPEHVADATDLPWADQPPTAIVKATLPALDYLGVPAALAVHPAQKTNEPATAWVCTLTIEQMLKPTADGGLGMDTVDLDLGRGWVWPQSSVKLGTWAKRIREAITAAGDDESINILIKQMYARYYTYFSSNFASNTVHYQPLWSGMIRADMRARALRFAARVRRDTGQLPVAGRVDAWIYRISGRQSVSVLEDTSPANGKYRIKEILPNTAKTWAQLTRAAAA